MAHAIEADLDANINYLNTKLGVGKSFDVIFRKFRFGEVEIGAWVINGFFQTTTNLLLLKDLEVLPRNGAPEPDDAWSMLMNRCITYSQVTPVQDLDDVALQVMSGPLALLVSGSQQAIVCDTRYYPDRQPSEPSNEQLVLGPHDGFIETLVFNTALIRRRVRDPDLRFEIMHIGTRSQTDVALGYIEGLSNPDLVDAVRRHLHEVDVTGLTMGEQPVTEFFARHPWNPLPTSRLTQRPDVAAFNLLEGHVLVLVDATPEVLIAPTTVWDHLQHPEDYHVSPSAGTYLRWVEFFALAASLLLAPLWLLLALHPSLVAHVPALQFVGLKEKSGIPLGVQFIAAEVAIDVLRRAILNTPHPMASTMGILGAVILGQVSSKVGLFSPETLVYMVIAAISNFAISSFEFGQAVRLARLSLIVGVVVGAKYGLAAVALAWIVLLLSTDSFGVPYLWPLVPFDWKGLMAVVVRLPVTGPGHKRPSVLGPLQTRWRS